MSTMFTTLVATAGLLLLATSPAQAAPPSTHNGCPPESSRWLLWDVAAEPYGVDNQVDEAGNNDGWACALPTITATDENGEPFQLYNFLDNQFVSR